VALARAIVTEPTVLLLDEPLSNLDLKLRESLRLEIKSIQRELGITAIYVTHDQGEALVMSDRIAVMNQGRIEQIGSPTEIYEAPKTAFVAEFIGTSNFLRGELANGLEAGRELASVTLRDGAVLRARLNPSGPTAGEVLVMVRPEHVVLGGDEGAANALRAAIREVVYLGSSIRYVAELASGERLTVEEQNRPGAARGSVGEMVTLRVAPEHCLVLDAADEVSITEGEP
jgi:spermidine/putrescine transport system ATP-binding protein